MYAGKSLEPKVSEKDLILKEMNQSVTQLEKMVGLSDNKNIPLNISKQKVMRDDDEQNTVEKTSARKLLITIPSVLFGSTYVSAGQF